MKKNKLQFSKKALGGDANSSNYVLSSVKSRWTWVLLSAISLFFSIALFWGFFGAMNETVSGVGITMLSKGSRPIIATGSGTISHLNIQSGVVVDAEEIVGQIFNAEQFFNLQKIESEYLILKSQTDMLRLGTDDITNKTLKASEDKKNFLAHLSEEHSKAKDRATEVSDIYLNLLGEGAESKISYYQALTQQLNTEASMISTVLDNINNESGMDNALWDRQQKLLSLEQELSAKERELNLAKKLYADAFWIRNTFSGTIREVLKESGASVQSGEKIALVDSDEEDGIYLLAYVSLAESNKVVEGMGAFFSPASLPSSEFGFLRCVVRDVGILPVTKESIQSELLNSSLTEMLAGQSAMVRVVLELIPDSKSSSNYAWTSKAEIPMEITNGMLGQVIINTDYKIPASYIVPSIRKFFDGDDIKAKEVSK